MNSKCIVCDKDLVFRWTDSHGIGVCTICGMPYGLMNKTEGLAGYHEPEPAMGDAGINLAKKYWKEKKSRVFPGMYDLGIMAGGVTSYSGATMLQIRQFEEWCALQMVKNG